VAAPAKNEQINMGSSFAKNIYNHNKLDSMCQNFIDDM
jgi:hypothetical protein